MSRPDPESLATTVVTDVNGNRVEELGYLPFGSLLYRNAYQGGQWSTVYRFTGQEYDAEFALYNYNARLYDPIMGRFISPDSIIQDPYNPQNLNRYSYCINNPLIYIDPTGQSFFGDIWGGITSAWGSIKSFFGFGGGSPTSSVASGVGNGRSGNPIAVPQGVPGMGSWGMESAAYTNESGILIPADTTNDPIYTNPPRTFFINEIKSGAKMQNVPEVSLLALFNLESGFRQFNENGTFLYGQRKDGTYTENVGAGQIDPATARGPVLDADYSRLQREPLYNLHQGIKLYSYYYHDQNAWFKTQRQVSLEAYSRYTCGFYTDGSIKNDATKLYLDYYDKWRSRR